MRLVTFGGLTLEGSDFSEQKPLLLLAYLAISGVTVRSEIAERFWGGPDKDTRKTTRSLETALGSLRGVDAGLITRPGRGEIGSEVACDARELRAALAARDYPRVMEIYRGPFLHGVERNSRLRLPESGELEEWIVDRRERLRALVQEAMLRRAEADAREERFAAAAELAWRALRLDGAVTYPTIDEYRRIHTLLLAGGRTREAEEVRSEAREFAEADELRLSAAPAEARRRLTFLAALPAPAEIFVGRDPEIAALLERLLAPRTQLVTLVGPAGVGKTALAVATAHEARRRGLFERGLGFAGLDGVPAGTPASELIERMATGLGLALPGSEPGARQLANAIGERATLLVLDNFEQLAPQAALLSEVIEACPALTLLVTSRVALALEREHVVRLEVLAAPPEHDPDPGDYPAVRVFLAAARRRGGRPRDADLPHVAAIARRVGGLPLALHLAAGWSRDLALADVAARLEDSLELLEGELRDLPDRQRSLRSAVDGSWRLLAGGEQQLFRRLAVFRDGFTLDAAERIAGAGPRGLRRLGDRSLLHFDPHEERHRLHPLIRRYAEERLAESPAEEPALRDAHARHYLERLREMTSDEPDIRNPAPRRLRPDTDNIVAAWRRAVERGWREELVEAGHALEQFCDVTGRQRVGVELLAAAEEAVAGEGVAKARLQAYRAFLILRTGRFDTAQELAQKALPALDRDAHWRACFTTITVLAICADIAGNATESERLFEEALRVAPEGSGNAATAHANLGRFNTGRFDFERAKFHLARAISLYRRLERRNGELQATALLADVLLWLDEVERARDLATATLSLADELGNERHQVALLRIVTESHLRLGDTAAAALTLPEFSALVGSGRHPEEDYAAQYLDGWLALATRQEAEGRELLARALRVFAGQGVTMGLRALGDIHTALVALGDEPRARALGEILRVARDRPDTPEAARARLHYRLAGDEDGRRPDNRIAADSLEMLIERGLSVLA